MCQLKSQTRARAVHDIDPSRIPRDRDATYNQRAVLNYNNRGDPDECFDVDPEERDKLVVFPAMDCPSRRPPLTVTGYTHSLRYL